MAEGRHIVRRGERAVPGEGTVREHALVSRLLSRGEAPSSARPVVGERVQVPEPTVRRTAHTVTPGRPAPLLARITRRKLVLEPSGPRRGGAR